MVNASSLIGDQKEEEAVLVPFSVSVEPIRGLSCGQAQFLDPSAREWGQPNGGRCPGSCVRFCESRKIIITSLGCYFFIFYFVCFFFLVCQNLRSMTLGRNRVPRWAENHERAITLRFFIFFYFLQILRRKLIGRKEMESDSRAEIPKRDRKEMHIQIIRDIGQKWVRKVCIPFLWHMAPKLQ